MCHLQSCNVKAVCVSLCPSSVFSCCKCPLSTYVEPHIRHSHTDWHVSSTRVGPLWSPYHVAPPIRYVLGILLNIGFGIKSKPDAPWHAVCQLKESKVYVIPVFTAAWDLNYLWHGTTVLDLALQYVRRRFFRPTHTIHMHRFIPV